MKYEVGKAYIHDGSAECPLPEGSEARSIALDCGYSTSYADNLPWEEILCFVPTFIPPQPREFWLAVCDGVVGGCYANRSDAEKWSSTDAEIVLFREVTE